MSCGCADALLAGKVYCGRRACSLNKTAIVIAASRPPRVPAAARLSLSLSLSLSLIGVCHQKLSQKGCRGEGEFLSLSAKVSSQLFLHLRITRC
jgi:hypothetical protein